MEDIKNYEGAVFFVDILGISALTNGAIPLKNEDFKPWLNDRKLYTNQFLGASILTEFRKLLSSIKGKNSKITITQLSDCAFIWSEDILEVLVFCSKFMHQAIKNGILCRGGLAYGEIIETKQPHNLGRFILGDAVTQAAKLESQSKGCRVLINRGLPETLSLKVCKLKRDA
ncbi:adenylate/guanylate cyclase domain-containing protein [Riemerella columbina]|uniref:adenylate/guanylate cyclase domain-containing protein n=1 Tax=Riemerella columbina TaxID=103810 RepID=UPI0003808A80|nr:adenylate/guanylate cyclase domain-containing protein [Riemerella columbina]